MQCYTELTPPTAVTHSLSLPFLSADSNNLIVAKTSLLQIFTTKQISIELEGKAGKDASRDNLYDGARDDDNGHESSFLGADAPLVRSERTRRTKLILVAEYTLSGTITSLARIKTVDSKSGGEALLVGFKDAKISLVEWDPERPGISTISIHYYEQDDFQGSPWAPRLSDCVNYLTADPGNRCAALKFGGRNLAIIPFKQEDEDINMDEWDEELDGPRPEGRSPTKVTNGDHNSADTPYGKSFILRLSALDPNLINPIHLAFLYEYREPTFGILTSTIAPSSSLLHERKDHLTYMVFTLDLHQKASTTILSVGGLPFDLHRVIPVPAPVGGALLIGSNELVHIDQAGKANGVGVNMFAKQCTSFGLTDQADLNMRLEGCTVEQLSFQNGEMLLILHDGSLAILSFRMDGRSVSGLSLRRVSKESGGFIIPTGASSASSLGSNALFIGSETADSIVLGWSRKSNQSSRRKGRPDLINETDDTFSEEDLEEDDIDDDLYGDAPIVTPVASNGITKSDSSNTKAGDFVFHVHDTLLNIAPIIDTTFGKPFTVSDEKSRQDGDGLKSDLELVAAVGKEHGGAIAVLHRNIHSKVIGRFEFPEARGIWTVSVKRPAIKGLETSQQKATMSGDYGVDAQFDRLMIVSKASEDAADISDVYALTSAGFEALTGTEFEPAAGATIEVGTLGNGMRIIQVLKTEIRSYDGDLGLAQILPMYDEDTGAEPKIISASFADPFVLLLRDDSSIFVAQCDDNNELEEIEREDEGLLSTEWLTGCLYTDTSGVFAKDQSGKGQGPEDNILMFLLSAGGALHIYALPDLSKPVYVAEGLCFVPPVLSAAYAARRSAARETISEILVADLGDEVSKTPYLILRPSNNDLTIYEPFRISSGPSDGLLSSSLQFLKIHNPQLAQISNTTAEEEAAEEQDSRDKPMRAISNLGGYSTVFLPGDSPSFVLKNAKSSPKVLGLQGVGVRGLSSFHTEGCDRGFIYTDTEGIARVSQLPPDTNFAELGMSVRKVELTEPVHSVTYHPPMESYIIATSKSVEFELPKDEDQHNRWTNENIAFKPTLEQGCLKLISPSSWSVIDTVELDLYESIMCVKVLNLETSETTNERKQLVVVGTALSKGEDLPTKGRIYVYDVVTVIPEPDRPETNKKLKLVAREEIPRGAITGVSEIGTQGFILVAQGQKCMVRGLKEDGSLLPVAFLDMNCYVTSVKELPGTGLCVLADAMKGVWLTGYTEEPYKFMLFGKSATNMEIVAADLLPDGNALYILAADADCNLHIMQYDPEHPKSLHGHLLLHRTTFSLGGHMATTMTLLPRTTAPALLPATPDAMDTAADATIPEHEILMTSNTGSIALLSPLSEPQYRRLSTLASHLANTLYHPCGLNPREYRIDKDAPEGMVGGRAVLDGCILARWTELGSQRKAEIAGRLGVDVEQVRDDLVALEGGLGYL